MTTTRDAERIEVHRPRCCDDPKATSSWAIGRHDNAFVVVYCDNCQTDLLTLDPPSAPHRDVYVGPYRREP